MAGKIVYKDIAPYAAADATFATSAATAFSTVDLNANPIENAYITLEHNEWTLSGDYITLDDNEVAFWSVEKSDANGEFTTTPLITITFTEQHSAIGISLIFDNATGDYCDKVTLRWYRGATLLDSKVFNPNEPTYFCDNAVTAFDKIELELNRTHLPDRYAKLSQILFGIVRTFKPDEIRSATITNQTNLISAELPASQLDWTLESKDLVEYMFQLRQPVEAYSGSALLGVFYVDTSKRLSERIYQVTAQDAIGILGEQMFDGGDYRSGKSAKAIVADIVGDMFTVTYDAIADTTLYGLLLRQTKREALHQVLFAWGAICRTDGGADIKIFEQPTTPTEIGRERTYTGVSVEQNATVTRVMVAAHTYTPNASGGVEVLGQKYADNITEYVVEAPDIAVNVRENNVEVTEATLVSTHNGSETANRIYNYYRRRGIHKSKIILNGEKLGDCVEQPTPWNTTEIGNIRAMSITLSGVVAADVESLEVFNGE